MYSRLLLAFAATPVIFQVLADSGSLDHVAYRFEAGSSLSSTISICPNEPTQLMVRGEDNCPVELPIPNPEYYPWDSAPKCLNTSDFCLYTSSSFASGRGISIITTQSTAASLASIPIFTTKQPPVYPPKGHNLYYEFDFPGRGRGVIANTTFHRGDLIFSHTPLLLLDEEMFEGTSKTERNSVAKQAVDALPPATRELFYSQAGHFGTDPVEDRIRTNGFAIKLGGRTYGALVPEAARLNHECRPNARYALDASSLTHRAHATRTIRPGEELTFSYINENQPWASRQAHLRSHWGFQCKCNHCSLPKKQRKESDARIADINLLNMELNTLWSPTTPDLAVELVELCQAEGLHASMEKAYMMTAQRFCAWEDEENTRKYAQLAVENWLAWEKQELASKEIMKAMAKDPKNAWCWGKVWEGGEEF
ncbi:hypothetical protein BP6252_07976 [Coleophoma cylindrospora]|uniref:SET domain-containing protein n=1 Tax=Coleophoma cylindrospora TaxID=1849047 RepID=A0A3D8RBI0_9HELO|nr:hypothetical protein BP6252_07976 [Coleophoma cylindrospora]